MSQPEWECIGQLGDANPLDHGGYWVFRDKTGAYPEEAELLKVPCDEDEHGPYVAHRFILGKCSFIDGVLSDNPYHPAKCAWWATTPEKMRERPQDGQGITDLASSSGMDEGELIAMFCSDDPIERATAYREVGNYHGFANLDDYPLEMTRREARLRYKAPRFQTD